MNLNLTHVTVHLPAADAAGDEKYPSWDFDVTSGADKTYADITPTSSSTVSPVSGQKIRLTMSADFERRKNGLVRILIRTRAEQAREPIEGSDCCCQPKDQGDDVYDVHTVVVVPSQVAERLRRRVLDRPPEALIAAIAAHNAVAFGGRVASSSGDDPGLLFEPDSAMVDILNRVLLDAPASAKGIAIAAPQYTDTDPGE